MSISIAKKVIEVSEQLIPMLTHERNRRVEKDLHDDRVCDTVKALDFYKELRAEFVDYVIKEQNEN